MPHFGPSRHAADVRHLGLPGRHGLVPDHGAGIASGCPTVPAYPVAYDAAKALHAAAFAKGSSDFAAQWAGQGASLARERPAAKLVEELIGEM